MADIDVVPKNRSGLTWLWTLLIVLFLLMAVWWFMGRSGATVDGTGRLIPVPASSPLSLDAALA